MYLSLSFLSSPFTPDRRLFGIFKCILRRGSPRRRQDFFSRMRRWEERKEEGFPYSATQRRGGRVDGGTMSPRGIRQRHKCILPLRDSWGILFHELYPSILSGESNAHSYSGAWMQNRLELTLVNPG